MKVTYNWLKDFVEIKVSAPVLADRLTMAGLEVTSLQEKEGDFVFEIEVTSNRPDCLSVIGIAREVAAITKSKIKNPYLSGRQEKTKLQSKIKNYEKEGGFLEIKIQDKRDCPLYCANIVRDVKVGSSPNWLKKRLELVGCRSVNNVVDITNYVLFESGQPLHAFDLDKLNGNTIFVRRASNGEKIFTIDGQERTLVCDYLVIADKEKAVAIAGIMGGTDTEVCEDTKNILLEAAVFNPKVVRQARQKLGVQSDSGYRFERGVDSEKVKLASLRATQLIQEVCAGKCVLAQEKGLTRAKKKKIILNVSSVDKILGLKSPASQIKGALDKLGFKIKPKTKNVLEVFVPSYRPDVNSEIDLIEEFSRIYGYGRIPKTLPKVSSAPAIYEKGSPVSLIKNVLVGLGLNEVVTYSLIDKESIEYLAGRQQLGVPIEILNPLSKEQEVLRPTLMPGLLKCVAFNLNQKQGYVNIFEIAHVFSTPAGGILEEPALGIALCGIKSLFLAQGMIKEETGFLHIKGILEVLFGRLGIKDYSFNNTETPDAIHVRINREKAGIINRVSADVLGRFDIKNKDVFFAELSLDKVFSCVDLKKSFVALARYPAVSRDVSFILKENIRADDMLKAIKEGGGPLLREAGITDYYKGRQIPPGYKGLTISCLYRSDERTLAETEINPIHSLVCRLLTDKFGAQIRA